MRVIRTVSQMTPNPPVETLRRTAGRRTKRGRNNIEIRTSSAISNYRGSADYGIKTPVFSNLNNKAAYLALACPS
jgi:hypothetical protein